MKAAVLVLGVLIAYAAPLQAHHAKEGFDRLEPIEKRSCSYRWGCKKHTE